MISGALSIFLGGINIVIALFAIQGKKLLYMDNIKSAFLTVFVICLFMCSSGISSVVRNTGFRITGIITGGLIGTLLIFLLWYVLTRKNIPLIGSEKNALIVLVAAMLLKMGITLANLILMANRGGLQ